MSAPRWDPDHCYATGEISREEWIRLRDTVPKAPSSLRDGSIGESPTPGRVRRVPVSLIAIAGVVLAVILVIWAVAAGFGSSPIRPSYGRVSQLSPTDVTTLNSSSTRGVAYASNNSLWFSQNQVRLFVLASPTDHDLTFVIQGLVNPTIHAISGAHIEVALVNLDPDMYHKWAVAQNGPPFGSMSMMGSGMMMSMAMLDPASSSGFWSQTASFTASSGAYWYLCEYPGHATDGMYGGMIFG